MADWSGRQQFGNPSNVVCRKDIVESVELANIRNRPWQNTLSAQSRSCYSVYIRAYVIMVTSPFLRHWPICVLSSFQSGRSGYPRSAWRTLSRSEPIATEYRLRFSALAWVRLSGSGIRTFSNSSDFSAMPQTHFEIISSLPARFDKARESGDLLFFPSTVHKHSEFGVEVGAPPIRSTR